MREAYMLDFPVREYETRIQTLATLIREAGMDAAILTTKENLLYFCGFQSLVWHSVVATPGLLIITADGKISLLGSQSCYGTLVATSCIDEKDIYGCGNQKGSYALTFADALGKLLGEKNLLKSKIGMEIGEGFRIHMTYPNLEATKNHLKDAQIMDVAPLLWKMRAIKSEAEMVYMRRVCQINCAMYDIAFNSVILGKTTEEDVFRTMAKAAFEMGCMAYDTMGIRSGADRYGHGNSMPTPRIIGLDDNEMMLIDGGPGYKGYWSDIIRQAVVGKPTELQKEAYAYTVDLTEYALSIIKPGESIAEVVKKSEAYAAKHKKFYEYYSYPGGLGHSIGLEIHELPWVKDSSDWVFQKNMCIAIEPTITIDGSGRFGIEQNIVVTDDGIEILSKMSTELIQLV